MMQNLTLFWGRVLQYFKLVDVRHTENGIDSVVLYRIQENRMKIFYTAAGKLIMLCLLPLIMVGCGREDKVSFSQDVRPIIDRNCIECHQAGGAGHEASGFNMETYEGLMKGTNFGPMIIARDAEGSNMLVLMEGRADPSISMPHGQQDQISTKDLRTIRSWIDQGAKNN
jgi:uncharacterized membrane protein